MFHSYLIIKLQGTETIHFVRKKSMLRKMDLLQTQLEQKFELSFTGLP